MTTGLADESDGMVLLGWSREKVRDHVTLRSRIGAEILVFAKSFQSGRAPSNGANAPKNERSVTSGLSGVILPLLYDKDSLLRCRNLLTYCRETSVFLAISLSDQFPHSISLSNVTHGGGRGERRRKMLILSTLPKEAPVNPTIFVTPRKWFFPFWKRPRLPAKQRIRPRGKR